MPTPFLIIDAFTTSNPVSGNPAAVVLLPTTSDWPDDSTLQGIATEFNQAETAFLLPTTTPTEYNLRWFTPTAEVDLCGHATMAATAALASHHLLKDQTTVTFKTKSGPLYCTPSGNKVTMDFPEKRFHPTPAPTNFPSPATAWFDNTMDWLAIFPDEQSIIDYKPDFPAIASLGQRGLIIAAHSSRQDADYVCRFFAPAFGVPEDHVTGSAHCCLAPHFSRELNKSTLTGMQLSSRSGIVHSQIQNDRVLLSGQCRVFATGTLKD